jgi:endonuclease YncB( thermonuclease family)
MTETVLSEIVAAGMAFTCTPTAVWDGDGPVWCAEGPKVRLAGIAAREIDGTCKPGHPCPTGTGRAARDHLVKLLGGPKGTLGTGHIRVQAPPLRCLSEGSGRGSRTAAWCSSTATGDLSCAMVSGGHAVRWGRYWRKHRCLNENLSTR